MLTYLSCQLQHILLHDSWLHVIGTQLRLAQAEKDYIDSGPKKPRYKTGSGMIGSRSPCPPSLVFHLSTLCWLGFPLG